MKEIGTLKELDVKPGDVVELLECGEKYVIGDNPYKECGKVKTVNGFLWAYRMAKIISRAPETPKLWRDMTDVEKGALLLAQYEGKDIQVFDGFWVKRSFRVWAEDNAYRIRPEPKIETISLYGSVGVQWCLSSCAMDTHKITFQIINGKPDTASVKMEAI